MKTFLPAVILSFVFLASCGSVPQPRESNAYYRPRPNAYLGDGYSRVTLSNDLSSTTERARQNVKHRYGVAGMTNPADASAIIFAQPLQNDVDAPASYVLEFVKENSRMPMIIMDLLVQGTSLISAEQLGGGSALPCAVAPGVQLEGVRRLYTQSVLSFRDFPFSEKRSNVYFGQADGDSADVDFGAGSESTRFMISVSLRECGLGQNIVTVSKPVEVYTYNNTGSVSLAGVSLGVFALNSVEDSYGINMAMYQALILVTAEVLEGGLERAQIATTAEKQRASVYASEDRSGSPEEWARWQNEMADVCAGNQCHVMRVPASREGLQASPQDDFCRGFSDGYTATGNSMSPLCPMAPLAAPGTSPYALGFMQGREHAEPSQHVESNSMVDSYGSYSATRPDCVRNLLNGDVVAFAMCN